jgi:Na+-translocating ferredoxin:NAD+ oxidoreductase RnfD subunit
LVIIVITLLTIAAALGTGVRIVAPGLIAAAVAAMLADAPILRLRDGEWTFPDGALLTGLFVALILSPYQPWYVAALTAIIAVVSKYVFRVRGANVFNPAALALVISYYIFHSGQSWWGALPELHPAALALLFATGLFIIQRVNKVPVVLSFLGSYYLLFTISAFAGDPGRVADLYRAPDLHASLFYAFFMVTDPPTSPPKHKDQIVYGLIAGVASFVIFQTIHAVYFLLAGLLIANVWESSRRWRAWRARSLATA